MSRTNKFVVAVMAAVAVVVLTAGLCSAQTALSSLGNKDGGKAETAIGSLVADAMKARLHTNISFVASSELKPKDPPIAAGKISVSDLQALISYPDDPLAVLELSGKTVRLALERSAAIYPQPNLGFLQVSGIKFAIDPAKAAGGRVTSITVGSAPLADDATYSVAVTNSMANGALGYWKIWTQDNVKKRLPTSTIVSILDEYFKANPKIDYSTLDHIQIAK